MSTQPSSNTFTFPSTGVAVPQATLLAIDDYLLPFRKNLCYYMTKPVIRPEPVIAPVHGDLTMPDNVGAHFYGSVLFEGGKFRMWYYACHMGTTAGTGKFDVGRIRSGPICYAESDDGVHWTRPKLGQVEFNGSRENNALALTGMQTFGTAVIKDEDDLDPQRRYKMVYQRRPPESGPGAQTRMPSATSPDGLHWTVREELSAAEGMEHASLYKFNGLYFLSGQMWPRGEGGRERGREGFAVVSPDFHHWIREIGEAFALPEPANPEDCGNEKPYDQVHLGVGAASFGNVLVGIYCIWHNQPTTGDWFGKGRTSGDLGLLVSNDGLHFREPIKGHIFIHRDESSPTPPAGATYQTILCQGNGILNVGDTTYIYHGRWANTQDLDKYHAEVGLARLPRDRWGALGLFPDQAEGAVWSAPVILPQGGGKISLNADGARGIRVEVADARFGLLPEFSADNAGRTEADGGLDCAVSWRQGNLAALGGQNVRFRIHLKREGDSNPRLYALYLTL